MIDHVTICPHRAKVIPEQPAASVVNKYRLTSTKSSDENSLDWAIMVENWSPELLNTDKFRLCFMKVGRGKGVNDYGVSDWRCRMLYDLAPHPNDDKIPEADPEKWYLPLRQGEMVLMEYVDGDETEEYSPELVCALDVLYDIKKAIYSNPDAELHPRRFKLSRRRDKLCVGFAIWEKTGKGETQGWERVSNISGLLLKVRNRADVQTGDSGMTWDDLIEKEMEYSSRIISIP